MPQSCALRPASCNEAALHAIDAEEVSWHSMPTLQRRLRNDLCRGEVWVSSHLHLGFRVKSTVYRLFLETHVSEPWDVDLLLTDPTLPTPQNPEPYTRAKP